MVKGIRVRAFRESGEKPGFRQARARRVFCQRGCGFGILAAELLSRNKSRELTPKQVHDLHLQMETVTRLVGTLVRKKLNSGFTLRQLLSATELGSASAPVRAVSSPLLVPSPSGLVLPVPAGTQLVSANHHRVMDHVSLKLDEKVRNTVQAIQPEVQLAVEQILDQQIGSVNRRLYSDAERMAREMVKPHLLPTFLHALWLKEGKP